MGWQAALIWAGVGSAVTLLCLSVRKPRGATRFVERPTDCQRFPDWRVHAPMLTRRQAE